MIAEDRLDSLRALVPRCHAQDEGGCEYVWLPDLAIQIGDITRVMDGLLALTPEGSYLTRLFLSQPIPERPSVRGAGWTNRMIFGSNWHTWSWKDVNASQPLIVVVRQHLGALK